MTLSTDNLDFLCNPATGDLDFTGGQINFVQGLPGVAQLARITIQTLRGELFSDVTFGLPLIANQYVPANQAILGQKPVNLQAITQAYYDVLITVPNVTEVILLQVAFNNKTRQLSVNWQLRTAFGDTVQETTTP